ncbi:MAG: hypothetical protein ACO4CT_18505, partial [Planctomycetota bacterium]
TGETFVLELTNLPNTLAAVSFGFTGFSRETIGGIPLPLDLSVVGMPGCLLLTSSEQAVTLPNLGGRATMSLSIPSDPVLLGSSLYFQGAALDRIANPQGIIVTNGVEARIGDR